MRSSKSLEPGRVTLHAARRWKSPWGLFVALVAIGCALRIGYGVAQHGNALSRIGSDFVLLWDHDALEHIVIAKMLIEEGAYQVGPRIEGKRIRYGPDDALFKAPLYQYFLAGVFAVSGFGFALFFPLQALIGGIASGLAALITLDLFGSRRAALFSGVATAANPLLVNSASQPYNENLFVLLLLGSIWAFIRWTLAPRAIWASLAGTLAGLAILCRESALPVLAALAAYAVLRRPGSLRKSLQAAVGITAVAVAVVTPWTVRNYVRTGELVPVSAISGTALALGNNECLAEEPLLSWYWADRVCASLNERRAQRLAQFPANRHLDRVVRNQINAELAAAFISSRPVDYIKLSAQRAWTVLLPFHPRQRIGSVQRAALLLYWLAVVPAGLLALVRFGRTPPGPVLLLGLLIAAIVVPQVLVYVTPDLRYRVPADLLLACLSGSVYAEWIRRAAPLRSMAQPVALQMRP